MIPHVNKRVKYAPIDTLILEDILRRFPVNTRFMDHTLPRDARSSGINIPRLFFVFPNGDELSVNVTYKIIEGDITLNAQVNNNEIWSNYPIVEEFIECVKFDFEFGVEMSQALRAIEDRMYQVKHLVTAHIPLYETRNT